MQCATTATTHYSLATILSRPTKKVVHTRSDFKAQECSIIHMHDNGFLCEKHRCSIGCATTTTTTNLCHIPVGCLKSVLLCGKILILLKIEACSPGAVVLQFFIHLLVRAGVNQFYKYIRSCFLSLLANVHLLLL